MIDRENRPQWNTVARSEDLGPSVVVERHMAVLTHPDPAVSICVQKNTGVDFLRLICDFCEYAIGQAEKTLFQVEQPNAALPITGDPREILQDHPPRQGMLRAEDMNEPPPLKPGHVHRMFNIDKP